MNAIKYATSVRQGGKVELDIVGLPEGTAIEVIVLYPADILEESLPSALAAPESVLAFWDNPEEEEMLSGIP